MTQNTALARAVIVHTLAFPENHNQETFSSYDPDKEDSPLDRIRGVIKCGSTACLAGTAVMLGASNRLLNDVYHGDSDWDVAALDLLAVTEDNYWALHKVFYTTPGKFIGCDVSGEERAALANAEAIESFCRVFDLDLEEIRNSGEVEAYRNKVLQPV